MMNPRTYKLLPFLVVLAGLAFTVAGCSSEDASKKDDAAIRQSMSKKTIDINDVPPEQRDRVRAYMNMSKSGPPQANAGSAPPKTP
jgi:hypothetical protein